MSKIRNQVEFKVYGKYALFSDPITRMGGEKSSYPVPTYQALKGIMESIYWKPSIIWIVDEVRVIKPIRTEAKNVRPISYNKSINDLSIYTYLVDVEYQVRAHFIPNPYRTESDLISDGRKEEKHHNIAKRMILKGGRRDIFLGTRECQAYVEPCKFGEGKSFYDSYGEINFGVMIHGINYPDETGKDEMAIRLWNAKMDDGIIKFIPPTECNPNMIRYVRPMKAKKFGGKYLNFTGLEEKSLQDELLENEEVIKNELDTTVV
jgi:CRISPR-associated protein Cas5d